MGKVWYYQLMGQIVGPINESQLRAHKSAGRISDDTLIREGKKGEWVPAWKNAYLFFGAANASATVHEKQSKGSVSQAKPDSPSLYSKWGRPMRLVRAVHLASIRRSWVVASRRQMILASTAFLAVAGITAAVFTASRLRHTVVGEIFAVANDRSVTRIPGLTVHFVRIADVEKMSPRIIDAITRLEALDGPERSATAGDDDWTDEQQKRFESELDAAVQVIGQIRTSGFKTTTDGSGNFSIKLPREEYLLWTEPWEFEHDVISWCMPVEVGWKNGRVLCGNDWLYVTESWRIISNDFQDLGRSNEHLDRLSGMQEQDMALRSARRALGVLRSPQVAKKRQIIATLKALREVARRHVESRVG